MQGRRLEAKMKGIVDEKIAREAEESKANWNESMAEERELTDEYEANRE